MNQEHLLTAVEWLGGAAGVLFLASVVYHVIFSWGEEARKHLKL